MFNLLILISDLIFQEDTWDNSVIIRLLQHIIYNEEESFNIFLKDTQIRILDVHELNNHSKFSHCVLL